MAFYNWIGVVPLLLTTCSILVYAVLLASRTNQVLANFFAALLIGAFSSASVFSVFMSVSPASAFAAQCVAVAIFLLLLKLAFSTAQVGARPLFVRSHYSRDQFLFIGIICPIAIAAMDLFPVDLAEKCTSFRCKGFDVLFGGAGSFSYYYVMSILGSIALFLIAAVFFNISPKSNR